MTKNCHPKYNKWMHYFALLTAIGTLLLLGLGGLVTSHEAGMSVPDWPNTYGYNMFLFPIAKWVGGVFYEHTHRLLASVVGLLTVALAVWFWRRDPRAWLRRLGLAAVALVLVQGVLGGLRVRWHMDNLGIFHGTAAQLFFILVCALGLWTSRWWWQADEATWPSAPAGLRSLVLAATALIFAQLILGATMRHQHAGLAIRDFPLAHGKLWPDTSVAAVARYNANRMEVMSENPITAAQIILQMIHRLAALAILLAVGTTAWLARRQLGARTVLARLAAVWLGLILVQIGLGIATLYTNKAADIATLHVLVGALVLATGALWCVIAFRRPAQAHPVSTSVAPPSPAAGSAPYKPLAVSNRWRSVLRLQTTAGVPQTSQSAVSRVSQPADRPLNGRTRLLSSLPIGKSAIQQVGKPAVRTGKMPGCRVGSRTVPVRGALHTAVLS
jgi:cytochrome c oxidase assembly protein subunit 15